MPIRFRFSEMREETEHFRHIARDLLDHDGDGVLRSFGEALTAIQSKQPGTISPWQIGSERPLRTIESDGEYEANGRRGHHRRLVAEMTCIWEISPVKPSGKKAKIEVFEVAGLASVRINMRELSASSADDSLGSWRMELGAKDAPGCFFHTQILGEDGRDIWPFPHSISVPRLPSIIFTPISVLEFTLGEVFQDRWRIPTRQGVPRTGYWASIQRQRFQKLFAWYQEQVLKSGSFTPWCFLKQQIPPANYFL